MRFTNQGRRFFPEIRYAVIPGILLLSLFVLAGCSDDDDDDHAPAQQVVETESGSVKGYSNGHAWIWHAIPYAAPPVGDLRWRAPQDPEPWTDVREATSPASACTQQVMSDTWAASDAFIGSEDCLYLDVYRPATDEENLPVYVWIHGGSNNFGTAQDYNGTALAARGDMVVVVVQYRLAGMGFLTHPALREGENDLDASGNYGSLDHQKALEWVRDNIAAFGGDPSQVTVGGESAGAHNTMNLIMSPRAAGLFDRAVVESAAMELFTIEEGAADTNEMIDWLLVIDETAADAEEAATVRAGMSNAEIASYLRGKSAEEIQRAARDGAGGGSMFSHSAYMDGVVLPTTRWTETIASGDYNRVPVLIGSNEFEFKNFMPRYGLAVKGYFGIPSGTEYSWMDLYNVFEEDLALEEVLPEQRDRDFYHTIGTLRSNLWKASYVDALARALKTDDPENTVYAYRFDWAGGGALPDFETVFGAAHAMEIPFFFGGDESLFGYSFVEENRQGREALQGAMMDYLISFIRSGDPNTGDETLTWPQWSNAEGEPKHIIFDAAATTTLLETSSEEVTLLDVATETAAAREIYNTEAELGVFNLFGLSAPAQ